MHRDLSVILIQLVVLVFAITLHEFAHAITADRLGDPTPRRQGRISILPPDHLDPIGTVMMILTTITGFGIGWGKPVMINPMNFRNPRKGNGIVAAAGPISNILQACVYAALFHAATGFGAGELTMVFLLYGVVINLSLAFFNLIPVGPLDGASVLTAYLPQRQAWAFHAWTQRYGMMAFLALILIGSQIGLLSQIIGPPVFLCMRLLGISA
jgi:Zn-dependent protease